MKKVTFTYTMEFSEDVTDESCIETLLEVMNQDDNYNDDQFKIEVINEDKG